MQYKYIIIQKTFRQIFFLHKKELEHIALAFYVDIMQFGYQLPPVVAKESLMCSTTNTTSCYIYYNISLINIYNKFYLIILKHSNYYSGHNHNIKLCYIILFNVKKGVFYLFVE